MPLNYIVYTINPSYKFPKLNFQYFIYNCNTTYLIPGGGGGGNGPLLDPGLSIPGGNGGPFIMPEKINIYLINNFI
jgi:hypothetical protein